MTTDQIDYLKDWLFRANEDILVIKNLFESEPETFFFRDISRKIKEIVESNIEL